MQHVCDPPACHHTEAAVFSVCVCFGWRACWLVSTAVNQSLPDGQEANLSPVCHFASTSQIAPDPAAPLISAWPQQRHTQAHTDPASTAKPAWEASWNPGRITDAHVGHKAVQLMSGVHRLPLSELPECCFTCPPALELRSPSRPQRGLKVSQPSDLKTGRLDLAQ